jgi:phosphoribosylformylglycinamidine synthase
MEGNYYADGQVLRQLEDNGQVVFRYCTSGGEITEHSNPNGSLNNIAGICNSQRNVLGLMPHPERASEVLLGSEDGIRIFKSMVRSFVYS